MASLTLEGPLAALREAEIDLLIDLADILGEMGEGAAEDRQRLTDVAQDLRELFFLVVVIGEFNAGKSTFVNALLGDMLLPTGITPTTEVIELIRYSETTDRRGTMKTESLREWAHPNTGAPGVAIVDTPGTGSIFQRHETTAKAFLHRSDLVIFLISAKRAFAQTERLYLEMAKNYGKKIILVVNQVDLLEPTEQAQVRRFIEQQVKELLNIQPLLFMVSAKEALSGSSTPSPLGERGGIDAVRAHLRGVFAEAPPAKQKLLAQLDTAENITRRYFDQVRAKADLVLADTSKVREVQQELQQQSLGMDAQLKSARAEIDNVFNGIRQRGMNFIDANLSARRLRRTVNREKLQADFQDVVIGRALRDINEATGDYVNAVVDQSRTYWRGVIERLNQLRQLLEQELPGLDKNMYAEQREGLEDAIRVAEAEIKTYSTGRIVDDLQQTFEANMNTFTTSALAAVGGWIATILAIAAPGPLVGAAAAAFVIAAPVAAVGSLAALRYYQRATTTTRNEFREKVDRLEQTYHTALDDLTRKERGRLANYGSQVLTPIFSRLEVLASRYNDQKTRLDNFLKRVESLRKGIRES